MSILKNNVSILTFLLLVMIGNMVHACSMYKITSDGKTMTGCNHDTWFTTPKIWFENAKKSNEYGACFTGAREVSGKRMAPQSGMNEKGLTFSRLVAYHPKQNNSFTDRIKIDDEVDYLTKILHTCATIEDVRKFIGQYDHSIFIDDVFIYIESSGKYLIVEPYKLIEGNDSNYVLANFCPSLTNNENARKLERYRHGEDFLKTHKIEVSIPFCTALSDTMHVCRSRNGDGTLLTSIWDAKDGVVNLYFYHSYESVVEFNVKDELAKGDHIIDVPSLFPLNTEFERLKSYKTPFNTPKLRIALVVMAGVLAIFALLIISACVIKNNKEFSLRNGLIFTGLNLSLIGYLFILATNVNIYYFDAPYKHYNSILISASSYIPFLLLLSIIPLSLFTISRLKTLELKGWIKATLVSNSLIYLILVASFGYWGLYSIWN
jgi:hypothetical protein